MHSFKNDILTESHFCQMGYKFTTHLMTHLDVRHLGLMAVQ